MLSRNYCSAEAEENWSNYQAVAELRIIFGPMGRRMAKFNDEDDDYEEEWWHSTKAMQYAQNLMVHF